MLNHKILGYPIGKNLGWEFFTVHGCLTSKTWVGKTYPEIYRIKLADTSTARLGTT